MYKKILQTLCILWFFIAFWYFYGDEYWKYREAKTSEQKYESQVKAENKSFDVSDIPEISGDTQLYYTPYLRLLDDTVEDIDSAKQRVLLEAYIFTESKMRDAIIRAHKRWIEVKVLLENNPYKAPYLNDKTYKILKESGVNVKWSDPLNYSLNHSKMLIVDNHAYISTGNFSYSLFKHNRDFVLRLDDSELISALGRLFHNDFGHIKQWIIHENIVLSPDNSRDKMTKLISGAQKKIDFYFPYISDDSFESELFKIAQKWVKVRWVVEEKFYTENPDVVKKFAEHGIMLRPLKKKKLHGKVIISDEKTLYLGSINFSRYSFDENREIGIILRNKNIIEKMQQVFELDF